MNGGFFAFSKMNLIAMRVSKPRVSREKIVCLLMRSGKPQIVICTIKLNTKYVTLFSVLSSLLLNARVELFFFSAEVFKSTQFGISYAYPKCELRAEIKTDEINAKI